MLLYKSTIVKSETTEYSSLLYAFCFRVIILLLIFISMNGTLAAKQPSDTQSSDVDRLELIRQYADRVLEYGVDQWSGEETPLLADGVNVDSGDPVVWRYNGQEFIVSNMASQQNLFRVLTGLSNLTGDERYIEAAKASIRYHFDNLATSSGLLRWGGHQFIDLKTLDNVNEIDTDSHEFKNHFPFYELMWEVDPQATARFLRALWSSHVTDWEVLDMNRHGPWNATVGDLWNHEFGYPEPFYEGLGLTFINAGSDLIYAAGLLYDFEQEDGALEWAKRLHNMYVNARHPDTGLGVYQYSKPKRREEPPEEGPLEGELTYSKYGDRAENQFGDVYGDVAIEGWVLWGGRIKTIYVENAFMQLGLAESMGEQGEQFLDETVSGLKALAEHSYQPGENHFLPMWADGTDLTGQTYPRTGYYGEKGTEWRPRGADMEFLMTYTRAFRLSGDEVLWETARQMAAGLGLGEIGTRPGQDVNLNMTANGASYQELFAMLELYRAHEHADYLERAEIVADRILDDRYHNGFFLPSEEHIHANFDRLEPLAILSLEAVLQGQPELVPAYTGGSGYIHGTFDDLGRTYDDEAIWSATREETGLAAARLISPDAGATVAPGQPEFVWEEVLYATEYEVQLTVTNFSEDAELAMDTVVTGTSVVYPGDLEENASYRWRVRARSDDEEGTWSDSPLFYTLSATDIAGSSEVPQEYRLEGNYPNPFNPATTIQYALPEASHVEMKVYDITGRELATLVNETKRAGYHSVEFGAADQPSSPASGVYMYRIVATPSNGSGNQQFVQTRKMTLVK